MKKQFDTSPRTMTVEAMNEDLKYQMAQKMTKKMLEEGMLSLLEYDKIVALNKKNFRPFLKELFD